MSSVSVPAVGVAPANRMDFDVSGNLIYFGVADPGTATSAAAWQIRKITWVGSNPTAVTFAGGTLAFTSVWDNRTGLSYS